MFNGLHFGWGLVGGSSVFALHASILRRMPISWGTTARRQYSSFHLTLIRGPTEGVYSKDLVGWVCRFGFCVLRLLYVQVQVCSYSGVHVTSRSLWITVGLKCSSKVYVFFIFYEAKIYLKKTKKQKYVTLSISVKFNYIHESCDAVQIWQNVITC